MLIWSHEVYSVWKEAPWPTDQVLLYPMQELLWSDAVETKDQAESH